VVDRSRIPTFAKGLPQTKRAVEYAEGLHAGQRRADGTPFILHPLEVASLLYYAADKLSKLRELRREAAVDSTDTAAASRVRELRARRLRHYQRSLALLEERLRDSPLVRQLRDELAMVKREQTTLARMR
jgi:hypothetical protein